VSTEGSPFHHNECEQRAVLCWSFGAMGGRLLHSTPRLHAFQILRPHITAVAHTSLTPRKAVLHFSNHPFPFKQACLLGTHVWQVRSAFGGHLCSHRDTSTGPNNYTHTSMLMYTHHSHPGKHSHIFHTTPSLSAGLKVLSFIRLCCSSARNGRVLSSGCAAYYLFFSLAQNKVLSSGCVLLPQG
jgi:hypothetical protein